MRFKVSDRKLPIGVLKEQNAVLKVWVFFNVWVFSFNVTTRLKAFG